MPLSPFWHSIFDDTIPSSASPYICLPCVLPHTHPSAPFFLPYIVINLLSYYFFLFFRFALLTIAASSCFPSLLASHAVPFFLCHFILSYFLTVFSRVALCLIFPILLLCLYLCSGIPFLPSLAYISPFLYPTYISTVSCLIRTFHRSSFSHPFLVTSL